MQKDCPATTPTYQSAQVCVCVCVVHTPVAASSSFCFSNVSSSLSFSNSFRQRFSSSFLNFNVIPGLSVVGTFSCDERQMIKHKQDAVGAAFPVTAFGSHSPPQGSGTCWRGRQRSWAQKWPSLMALFHCMVRHGTVRYSSLLGGFPLGTVPGTFLVPPQPRFQAIRTVTKTVTCKLY